MNENREKNENISHTDPTLARIRWQCRRGMLELDIVLISFVEQHFNNLSLQQKRDFAELLENEDTVLYQWITGAKKPGSVKFQNLITLIKHNNVK